MNVTSISLFKFNPWYYPKTNEVFSSAHEEVQFQDSRIFSAWFSIGKLSNCTLGE